MHLAVESSRWNDTVVRRRRGASPWTSSRVTHSRCTLLHSVAFQRALASPCALTITICPSSPWISTRASPKPLSTMKVLACAKGACRLPNWSTTRRAVGLAHTTMPVHAGADYQAIVAHRIACRLLTSYDGGQKRHDQIVRR